MSAKHFFPLVIEQLEEGRKVRFIVSGSSMMPWIVNNRDSVELVSVHGMKLKKGDIILFQPLKGKYILHRIIKVYPEGYATMGDGNFYPDGYTAKETVIAKVVSIYRKGKKIDCESKKWKLVFRLWMLLYPVRRYLIKILGLIGRLRVN